VYSYDHRQATRPIPLDRSAVQKLVRDIQRELPRHLKFRNLTDPLWMQRGFNPNTWGFKLDDLKLQDVQGYPVIVEVAISAGRIREWGGAREFIKGGGVRSQYRTNYKGRAVGYGIKSKLTIEVNSGKSPKDLMENPQVTKELTSVVSHEMTHLRDLLKHYGPVEEDTEEGVRDYYNRPTEIRAFMRQISDEVIDYAHAVGRDDPFFLDFSTRFIENGLDRSKTWERVRKELTEPNRRLILRGVTRALQDEWPKLQELYPQEDEDW
jgi:hypothetical protein